MIRVDVTYVEALVSLRVMVEDTTDAVADEATMIVTSISTLPAETAMATSLTSTPAATATSARILRIRSKE